MDTQSRHIEAITLHFPGEMPPPPMMANEKDLALKTLTEDGHFKPLNDQAAPYKLDLSIQDNRLVFEMENAAQEKLPSLVLSLKPYHRLIKDYFMMIESYESMRNCGTHCKLEAIDMGRRGLHNEGAELMMQRLADKIEMNLDTARSFFTLVCVLQAGASRTVFA